MKKAQSALVPFWYTPQSELEADVKTRFQLCGLSGIQKVEAFNEPNTGARVRTILRLGIKQWENYVSANGSPVLHAAFLTNKDDKVTSVAELVDMLSETDIYELSGQIIQASQLGEQEKKP